MPGGGKAVEDEVEVLPSRIRKQLPPKESSAHCS